MPTPTQAWLGFERCSLGLSIPQAAAAFGATRSVMYRAERGVPGLLDRVATAAVVELGSWPAPDPADVDRVLHWWRQHPLDRLAHCLKSRHSDWQTPLRHFARCVQPLPAVLVEASALDMLLPPENRAPPIEWTLACPWIREPCRLVHRRLGVLHLTGPGAPGLAARAAPIPGRHGTLGWGALRIAHPRDLMRALGWSPGLAAAVRAADLAGAAAISGSGQGRLMVEPHQSTVVHVDDGYWDDID